MVPISQEFWIVSDNFTIFGGGNCEGDMCALGTIYYRKTEINSVLHLKYKKDICDTNYEREREREGEFGSVFSYRADTITEQLL